MNDVARETQVIKIGVMPSAKFEKRMLDIAVGKYKPNPDEPQIWFNSIKSMTEALSENNIKVLEIIEK